MMSWERYMKKYDYSSWYKRDGEEYKTRVNQVLNLKESIYG